MQDFNDIMKIISKNYFTSDDKKKVISFFDDHKGNDEIIKKIIHIKDFNIYLKLIHLIEHDVDVSMIEELKLQQIKKHISNILKNKESSDIKNEIIYYYFRDSYYNFLVNFHNMLRYMRHVNQNIVSIDNIKIYTELSDIGELPLDKQVMIFNKYINKNIMEMFYDDMRMVKNHSYQNMVGNTLDLDDNLSLYNEELSKKHHISVYYLNGEDFYSFVRSYVSISNEKDIFCNLSRKYYSFSYIGSGNIGTIGEIDFDGVLVMYGKINPNNIVHVHHTDGSSSILSKQEVFISDKINEIHSPKTLMFDTKYYNEIVIKKEDNGITPTAIVCFDNIKEKDINIANKYKLPIVLINSKKYYHDVGYPDFNNDDTYGL